MHGMKIQLRTLKENINNNVVCTNSQNRNEKKNELHFIETTAVAINIARDT